MRRILVLGGYGGFGGRIAVRLAAAGYEALAPRSEAREWSEDERFWFDVPIALPLIGRLVHYRGWLKPDINGDRK